MCQKYTHLWTWPLDLCQTRGQMDGQVGRPAPENEPNPAFPPLPPITGVKALKGATRAPIVRSNLILGMFRQTLSLMKVTIATKTSIHTRPFHRLLILLIIKGRSQSFILIKQNLYKIQIYCKYLHFAIYKLMHDPGKKAHGDVHGL